jgi:hypothetical protein
MSDYRSADAPRSFTHYQPANREFQRLALPIVDQCCRRMEFAVGKLIEDAKAEAAWTESYLEAAALLESVPLDTKEFAIAGQRLENALHYCLDGEFGAACFELRQLRSQLAAL